jgi:Icc protein
MGRWLVLGLDTSPQGKAVENKSGGFVDAEELAWLCRALRASAGAPVVLMMHHPPVAGIGSLHIDSDAGAEHFDPACRDELGEALRPFASQVKAIVCGHVHQAFEGSLAGIPVLATPSTMCQLVPRVSTWDEGEGRDKSDSHFRGESH